jgi:alpha-glucuronidase
VGCAVIDERRHCEPAKNRRPGKRSIRSIPGVKAWWAAKVDEVYKLIPDFAGFTVKADSEGQAGPASYGRSPADAANLLANALKPRGGVVLYRAFVYNNHLDYNDLKADRARAAYDIFHPLDGKFAPTSLCRPRKARSTFRRASPCRLCSRDCGKTNQAMEVQITQEYLGQQRHLVYIAPMWKQVLDFDLRAQNRSTPVKEILKARASIGRSVAWWAWPAWGAMVGLVRRWRWRICTHLGDWRGIPI